MVGLVGAEVVTVKQAIPIIMGANIGTSVTNTIVPLKHGPRLVCTSVASILWCMARVGA